MKIIFILNLRDAECRKFWKNDKTLNLSFDATYRNRQNTLGRRFSNQPPADNELFVSHRSQSDSA